MKKKKERTSLIVHVVFILFGICCIVPFMMVVSASFSSELDLSRYGFRVLPKKVDLAAYAYLFANPKQIIDAYAVTIFISVVSTILALMVQSMAAYALARNNFRLKDGVMKFLFFPNLFSGGMVAHYIVYTQVYGLTDSIWIMILPGLTNIFHVIMIRTFFKQLPAGLFDAAKIDGASEFGIYFNIALRLSKPVIATVAFMFFQGKWNSWQEAMMYIRTPEKYPLQYLLQRMMMNIEELLRAMEKVPMAFNIQDIPGENLRMALLVVCIGPMMVVFPFFQKYFNKGMTMGAVKG